jgi:predicted Zn-dependent protease
LRQRSLDSIIEMARWHDLQHALPAFILAGRIAGLDDKTIQNAWINGNREPVLEKALHPNKKIKIG